MRLEAKQPPAGKVFKKTLRLPGKRRRAHRERCELGPYQHTRESAVQAFQRIYSEYTLHGLCLPLRDVTSTARIPSRIISGNPL
jgi:hypothetical protein